MRLPGESWLQLKKKKKIHDSIFWERSSGGLHLFSETLSLCDSLKNLWTNFADPSDLQERCWKASVWATSPPPPPAVPLQKASCTPTESWATPNPHPSRKWLLQACSSPWSYLTVSPYCSCSHPLCPVFSQSQYFLLESSPSTSSNHCTYRWFHLSANKVEKLAQN